MKNPFAIFIGSFGFILFMSFIFSQPVTIRSSGPQLSEIDFNFFSKDIQKNHISQSYGATLFSAFNYKKDWHNGIDIVAQKGAPIYSATNGIVFSTGNQDNFCYKKGFGKFVVVKNNNDEFTLFYAHLNSITAKSGAAIKKGEKIGTVGDSGFATGPHLHFSVFESKNFEMKDKNGCGGTPEGEDANPFSYLKGI